MRAIHSDMVAYVAAKDWEVVAKLQTTAMIARKSLAVM